jgi:hypothetical protein
MAEFLASGSCKEVVKISFSHGYRRVVKIVVV